MRPLLAVLRLVAGHDINFVRDAGYIIEAVVVAVWVALGVAAGTSLCVAGGRGRACKAARCGASRRGAVPAVASAWVLAAAYCAYPWHVREVRRGADVGVGNEAQPALRIATFNLRASDIDDGPVNGWPARKGRTADALADLGAVIVGTQEGTQEQLEYLTAGTHWRWFGAAAEVGGHVYDTAVLYNSTAAILRAGDTVWLSDTPAVPGTKLADSALYRTLTWGLFDVATADCAEGRHCTPVLVFNTHLDHVGEEARRAQVCVLQAVAARVVAEHGGGDGAVRQVLLGDFNTLRHTVPWHTLTAAHGCGDAPALQWRDALEVHPGRLPNDAATFHGYNGGRYGSAAGFMIPFRTAASLGWLATSQAPLTWHPTDSHIDWVLVRGASDADVAATELHIINAPAADGAYPSDHYPLLLLWRLPPPPAAITA